MRRKWCRRRLDMLSIKPRQRAGGKGEMLIQVGQIRIFGSPLRNIIPKHSELIYNTKKMRKCLWGTSARRTGVCFLFVYLEVICSYSSMQKLKLKYA